nr:MAG TPA: homing endonuclease [Caudoviricetes sp.]
MIEWKRITGMELYEVSNDGHVRNAKTKRLITHYKNNMGYWKVFLSVNGKTKPRFVHRLVAMMFLEPIKGKNTVDHINRDRNNNNVSNLRWATLKEQSQNKHTGKSTAPKPIAISNDIEIMEFPSMKECAEFLKCSPTSIHRLAKGQQKTCKGWVLV